MDVCDYILCLLAAYGKFKEENETNTDQEISENSRSIYVIVIE